MNKLDIAKRKLERLENDLSVASDKAFAHMRTAHGSPVNDKRGGCAFLNKQDQLEMKCYELTKEIEKQKDRIENLEWQEENKNNGLNSAGGLIKAVYNIDRFRERIAEMEEEVSNGMGSAYTRKKIKQDKITLASLIEIRDKVESTPISEHAQSLIDNCEVKQWAKNPQYYFVSSVRKVALVLDESGEFKISDRFKPQTEEDRKKVNKLINQ